MEVCVELPADYVCAAENGTTGFLSYVDFFLSITLERTTNFLAHGVNE